MSVQQFTWHAYTQHVFSLFLSLTLSIYGFNQIMKTKLCNFCFKNIKHKQAISHNMIYYIDIIVYKSNKLSN